ncbi:MAG: hypothetical protein RLZZ210_1227 [Pseudomonadota bacterium]|jgi:5-methylcytosine-specific restriction endonuclease McrA
MNKFPELPDFSALFNEAKEKMGINKNVPIPNIGITIEVATKQIDIKTESLPELSIEKIREILQNSTSGIDVKSEELKWENDLLPLYKGERVLLYIRDINSYNEFSVENAPRFHLVKCKTLKSKFDNNEKNRYVVSQKTDGVFKLNIREIGEREAKLYVCMNCLSKLNFNSYKNSHDKIKEVKNFSIEDFFTQYPSSLHTEKPDYNSDNAPIDDYSEDFTKKISTPLREKHKWRCQQCNFDCSTQNMKKYLHTHHVNRRKNDNREENLKVLCIKCHANEHNHHHIKNLQDYKSFEKINKN